MKLLLVVGVVALSACRSISIQEVNRKYSEILAQREGQYKIKPGDSITIKFYGQDAEINQTLMVLPDGRSDPFFMNDAVMAGKTLPDLEAEIKKYYADQVKNTEVSIQIAPSGETIVIEGQVERPLQQPFTHKMTLLQALGNSGGYKLTACLHTVIVRRSYLNPRNPDVFRVNIRKYADLPEDLMLLPRDHIILERNWAILVRDYIDEYVWGFLPPFFRTFSTYALTAL